MAVSDLMSILPELALLVAASAILLIDAWLPERHRMASYYLSQVALGVTLVLVLLGLGQGPEDTFGGAFAPDGVSQVLKVAVLVVTMVVLSYSRDHLRQRGMLRGEYFVLALFSVLGMMVLASSKSLVVLYLGLELLALGQYALVAFRRDHPSGAEAAMKYFVLGALSSGMLLYGMSILYGLTGTLFIEGIAGGIASGQADTVGVLFATTFLVIGVGFKLGVAPFHMWIPDVYEGAPTPVALFIGAAPKIAAFALMYRVLIDGLPSIEADWAQMLALLAAASLVLGNVVAIAQTNFKRMLAYSTIGHMGFVLLGFVATGAAGAGAAMFYAITYALMAAAAFGVLLLLDREGVDAESLDDFKGLNQRSPWFAFMMLLVMFSMAGVPPTIGFHAKLVVLDALIGSGDWLWLAVLAVVTAVIAAFYYLRIVRIMYFDPPLEESVNGALLESGRIPDMRVLLSANGLLLLLLGLFPGPLIGLCLQVVGVV